LLSEQLDMGRGIICRGESSDIQRPDREIRSSRGNLHGGGVMEWVGIGIGGVLLAFILLRTYGGPKKPQVEIDEINQRALQQALKDEFDED
jgi:hypothetical protein